MALPAVARALGEGDHGPVRCKEVGRNRRASPPYAPPAFGRRPALSPQGGPVIRPGVADRKPFVGEDADSPVIVDRG